MEKLLHTVIFSHGSLTLTIQAKTRNQFGLVFLAGLQSDQQSTMQSALLAGEEGWGTRQGEMVTRTHRGCLPLSLDF